jgi:hypothetical protein
VAQEELAEGVGVALNMQPEQLRIGQLRIGRLRIGRLRIRGDALPWPGVPRLGAARLVGFRRTPPLGPARSPWPVPQPACFRLALTRLPQQASISLSPARRC